jgi:hypothetical protein
LLARIDFGSGILPAEADEWAHSEFQNEPTRKSGFFRFRAQRRARTACWQKAFATGCVVHERKWEGVSNDYLHAAACD